MRKILSTLFIILGISMLLYPKAMEKYQMYKQEKLIREWENTMALIDGGYDDENHHIIEMENTDNNEEIDDENNNEEIEEVEEVEEEIDKEERIRQLEKEKQARDEYIKNNMEGILKIDKIDLHLPVLRGATEKNMKISVASIKGTGKIGDMGNYAIAGHRNYTYGRNFNAKK